MMRTPSLVRREPASRIRRWRTSSGSDGECATSKRSCTADDTLLTFCPPGPEASTKLSESSLSSMAMSSVTRKRGISIRQPEHVLGALKGKFLRIGDGFVGQHTLVDI